MRVLVCLSLLAVVGMTSLGGCAFMSDEDRDFYGKGWVHPTDLDKPTQHHIPDPDAAPLDSAPATTTTTQPSSDSDEWTAPRVQ